MQQLKQNHLYEGSEGNRYQGDENDFQYPQGEIETLHLYVYPDKPLYWTKDRIVALAMGLLTLALMIGLCCIPTGPSYTIQTLHIPARFTPQELKVSIPILSTGRQNYPATRAIGTLTIYNGSFLTQQLPAHFILTTQGGLEVATDQAVIIPSGNPPSYGTATVSAHALLPGSQGNIQADAIDQTYGSAIYIKNLAAFTNGQDAFTKIYATSQDQAKALNVARAHLVIEKPIGLLAKPCTETVTQQTSTVSVSWLCRFVTYRIPKNVQILSVQVSGDIVFVRVKVAIPAVVRVEK